MHHHWLTTGWTTHACNARRSSQLHACWCTHADRCACTGCLHKRLPHCMTHAYTSPTHIALPCHETHAGWPQRVRRLLHRTRSHALRPLSRGQRCWHRALGQPLVWVSRTSPTACAAWTQPTQPRWQPRSDARGAVASRSRRVRRQVLGRVTTRNVLQSSARGRQRQQLGTCVRAVQLLPLMSTINRLQPCAT
jgi:hypothetical protein